MKRQSRPAATGWKWQRKGDGYWGARARLLSASIGIASCLVESALPYTTAHRTTRVHKPGIKLPLYKNRSLSSPPQLERFAVYATESSDCVTSSGNIQFRGLKSPPRFVFFFFFNFLRSHKCCEEAGSFQFGAAGWFCFFVCFFFTKLFFFFNLTSLNKVTNGGTGWCAASSSPSLGNGWETDLSIYI